MPTYLDAGKSAPGSYLFCVEKIDTRQLPRGTFLDDGQIGTWQVLLSTYFVSRKSAPGNYLLRKIKYLLSAENNHFFEEN
jgi:hypothetical protein